MTINNKEPLLRICVTNRCNYQCIYCRAGGEGTIEDNCGADTKNLMSLMEIASKAGFKHLKFTGGEPIINKDIFKLIKHAIEQCGFSTVGLVTNGFLLRDVAQKLKNSGLQTISVSLDTMDSKLFSALYNTEGIDRVFDGIKEAIKVGIRTTISVIAMTINITEIERFIEFSKHLSADLKISDLMDTIVNDTKGKDFAFNDYYFDVSSLIPSIENRKDIVKKKVGQQTLGSPLIEYLLSNGSKIKLKNSTLGTFYVNKCEQCKFFPCQNGMLALRITDNLKLKKCLLIDDDLYDALQLIRNNDLVALEKVLSQYYKLYKRTVYYPNKWTFDGSCYREGNKNN